MRIQVSTIPIKEVKSLTRNDIVPYYRHIILSDAPDEEVKRLNHLILTKWKYSGLIYIKEKAWKGLDFIFWGGEAPKDLVLENID